jgi:hypothetical protein
MAQKINESLQVLAKRLNLIGPDDGPEEYILTPEEEEKVLNFEIQRAKEHFAWKIGELSTKDEIDFKISQINWDERIDRDAILQRTNSIKNYDKWLTQQRAKEIIDEAERLKKLQETWSATNLYKLMAWTSQNEFGKKLIIKDKQTGNDFTHLITAICFFVARDERFETELGFSLKKGLLIRGVSGLGKTHLVKCICKNGFNPILTLSMLDISEEIRMYGEYSVSLDGYKVLYLDDVGTEEANAKHYGNVINFFKNFIEGTYLRSKTQIFNHIMMSTNNSFAELEQKYGFRVRSRIKDMFNVIDVTGKDMRG